MLVLSFRPHFSSKKEISLRCKFFFENAILDPGSGVSEFIFSRITFKQANAMSVLKELKPWLLKIISHGAFLAFFF